MKTNKLLILFTFLSIFLTLGVNAEELGSIKGSYTYDNKPLTSNTIHLYHIADFKDLESDEKFTYLENYTNLELDINTTNKNEWQNYANILKTYIETNSLNYDYEVITDNTGDYEFKELKQGLYLMLIDEIETDLAYYKSLPSLISIPNYNEVSKTYINDITVNAKIEETLKEIEPEPTPEPVPDVPQTGDNILIYIIILVIALIIIIVTGIYIYKTKKEMKKDENKE